jgi:hypothetical protein
MLRHDLCGRLHVFAALVASRCQDGDELYGTGQSEFMISVMY